MISVKDAGRKRWEKSEMGVNKIENTIWNMDTQL